MLGRCGESPQRMLDQVIQRIGDVCRLGVKRTECQVKHIAMLQTAALAILSLSVVACSKAEPIEFDDANDWHCALAFEQTARAATKTDRVELANSMQFRAKWALEHARKSSLPEPTAGQKVTIRSYLESGAREGSQSTIACRHRQNSDPHFPASEAL